MWEGPCFGAESWSSRQDMVGGNMSWIQLVGGRNRAQLRGSREQGVRLDVLASKKFKFKSQLYLPRAGWLGSGLDLIVL